VRIQPATGAKEKRLAALLEEKSGAADPSLAGAVTDALAGIVADAQLLGSLDLSGIPATWQEVRDSRASGNGRPAVLALRRAQTAVSPAEPLTVGALRAWHAALLGPVGFRTAGRSREAAPTAPPAAIESRLLVLEEWLDAPGARSLRPEQAAALAYARIVEVLPFDDGNGRVARLAASHLLVRGNLRPPVLVGGDGPYLLACLRAAFRLETERLVSLLVEASGRALDVMIQALERGEV
jgi:hypothetical protein